MALAGAPWSPFEVKEPRTLSTPLRHSLTLTITMKFSLPVALALVPALVVAQTVCNVLGMKL